MKQKDIEKLIYELVKPHGFVREMSIFFMGKDENTICWVSKHGPFWEFNANFCRKKSKEVMTGVILHELGHLMCSEHGHGSEWQDIVLNKLHIDPIYAQELYKSKSKQNYKY